VDSSCGSGWLTNIITGSCHVWASIGDLAAVDLPLPATLILVTPHAVPDPALCMQLGITPLPDLEGAPSSVSSTGRRAASPLVGPGKKTQGGARRWPPLHPHLACVRTGTGCCPTTHPALSSLSILSRVRRGQRSVRRMGIRVLDPDVVQF
jgi:hypothetical protein